MTTPTGSSFAARPRQQMAARGRSKTPALRHGTARALSAWLRGVSSGHVPVVGWTGDEEVLKAFIEPNLAFSLASREAGNLRLRVHLSLESLPPWLRGQVDLYEYFIELDVTLADLAAAIASWDAKLAEFPQR